MLDAGPKQLWADFLEAAGPPQREAAALALVEALGPLGADECLALASGPEVGPPEAARRLRQDLLQLAIAAARRWGVPRVGLEAALSLGEWPALRPWAREAQGWHKPARWAASEAQGWWSAPLEGEPPAWRRREARLAVGWWVKALAAASRSQEALPEALAWPAAAALAAIPARAQPAMRRSLLALAPRLAGEFGPGGLAPIRLALGLLGPVGQAGPRFAEAWALAEEHGLQEPFAEGMAWAVGARAGLAQAEGEDPLAWLEAMAGA